MVLQINGRVNGDVKAVGSILIYGRINGNVASSGTVTTAKNSYVKGNIESKDAIISGKVDGDLKIDNKTTLEQDCILNGNLTTSIVVMEEGATFEGICNMLDTKKSHNASIESEDSETFDSE